MGRMSDVIVSGLAIYPVKSMRQIVVQNSAIDMCGLKHDRRWMVVDVNGRMLTQRKISRMCLIQPTLNEQVLSLHVPGMPDLQVNTEAGKPECKVTVWKDNCSARDCGDEAAHWFSKFLQVECRLVYFPDDEIRKVDQGYAHEDDRTAFSDGFPVLLISQPSLDDLNGHITSSSNKPVPMARFRPNIVVDGCGPYAEDDWRVLKIGGLTLRIVKPCSRCIIPSIDIATAERGEEPTRTLLHYRKRDNKIYFGQNAVIDGVGEIRQGMTVDILE
jgi:uncharacterized protein YcbX